MMYPPSYAMDATASGGGPSTMLPQIVTGSPESILAHVSEMLQKAQQFTSLVEEFRRAEQQLQQVWSGHAADSAVKKIENSLSSFTDIVNVINRGAQLLQQSATLVRTAQTGYTSVVGAVNPTVAGLMSNPFTYSAAVALSTSTSGALKGFITAVSGLLKTLGAVNLASELSTVGQIIGQLEQLFGNKGTGATSATGTAATTGTDTSAVTAPQAPGSVGDPSVLTSGATATPVAASTTPTSLQNGEQGLLHTPDGRLYTADGQPLLTASGTPAYQNYQPAALSGLANSGTAATTGAVPGTADPSSATIPSAGAPTAATVSTAATVPTAGTVPVAATVPTAATVPATPAMPSIPSTLGATTPAVDTSGLVNAVNSHLSVPDASTLGTAGLGAHGLASSGLDTGSLGLPTTGSGTDGWLAVDPSQSTAAIPTHDASGLTDTSGLTGSGMPTHDTSGLAPATPVDTGSAATPVDTGSVAPIGHGGEEITVTTTHAGTTTTVEVPMDAHEQVTVTAEGTVTVG